MSVLIKGIKMPNKHQILTLYIDGDGTVRNYDRLTKIGEAVEVSTPHGRLIDVNTVLHDGDLGCIDELVNDPFVSEEYKVGVKAARVIVCSAPTIIEAEE